MNITAMILAAGYGTRMKPLTQYIPKPLIPFFGIPIIEWIIYQLANLNIKALTINVHHLYEHFEDWLKKNNSKFNFKINLSYELPKILGTAGCILNAKKYLDTNTFIVANSDIIIPFNVKDLINNLNNDSISL